jgi:hypothetical protein
MPRPPSTRRRIRAISIVLAVLLLVPAPTALAWSNGRNGPNSFGTHDWVLHAAVKAVGKHGRWVCLRKALRATDDPDTVTGIDHASGTWWHVYDRWGSSHYGNAPEAVRVWFGRTQRKLRAGNRCGASRALGIMSHMLADVAQPMHTDQTKLEEKVHARYEVAVDTRCTSPSSCRYRFGYDGVHRAKPYGRTVAVATKAHRHYSTLVTRYARRGYDGTVDRITRRQLNRAAQALADLMVAVRR